MSNVIERDNMKNFQSPIKGKEIMSIFSLKEGKKVGLVKRQIEEAILDGLIDNTYDAAYDFLLKKKEMLSKLR
jgi:hypothetical protein